MVKEKEKSLNSYQRASKHIQEDFFRKADFARNDMMETMRKAQDCLKRISVIKTRSAIENHKYGSSTTPALLWQEEFVFKFYFFAVMLGFIDARIDDCKREIKFYSEFLVADEMRNDTYHKDTVEDYKKLMAEYLLDRRKVLADYTSVFIDKSNTFKTPAEEVLETVPSYLRFSDLYKDSAEHNYSENLQQNLISAYNIGFIDWDGDYDQKIRVYEELFSDLKNALYQDKKEVVKETGSEKPKIKIIGGAIVE